MSYERWSKANEYRIDIDGQPESINLLNPLPFVQNLRERLNEGGPKKILDLGCNYGNHALYLAESGHSVVGIDMDLKAARIAGFFGRLWEADCNFAVGDIARPMLKGQFDVVMSTITLHQLGDKEKVYTALEYMQSLTKPGGINAVLGYAAKPGELSQPTRNYMFEPEELKNLYLTEDWAIEYYQEEFKPVTTYKGQERVSSRSEIIAVKPGVESKIGSVALAGMDAEYWRRADPEYYEMMVQLGHA